MISATQDDTLIDQIRAGNETAWEELISRFERRLIAFAHSRIGNRAAAEDVVQEAFLGFLISLPNYDTATPLEAWLFRITAHKLTDYLRREGRRPRIPLLADNREGGEPMGDDRRASSIAQSLERRRSEEQALADALRELLSQWQAAGDYERLKCLELLFVCGLSNKQAAQRLGISEQAVANHKFFAIRKLKAAVGESAESAWQIPD